MPPLWVEKVVDVFADGHDGLRVTVEPVPAKQFRFERAEKTFLDRVVPAIAGAAHTDAHSKGIQAITVLATRIGAAAIKVVQHAIYFSTGAHSRVQAVASHDESGHQLAAYFWEKALGELADAIDASWPSATK